jgi:hypothetical protein
MNGFDNEGKTSTGTIESQEVVVEAVIKRVLKLNQKPRRSININQRMMLCARDQKL